MSKSKPARLRPKLTDALRTAINEGGVTRYRIAKDTGILETSLSRFMRGETSLRLDKADLLADYLGLKLVKKAKGKVNGSGGRTG
jgi:transcriptional regulator with XRE-family HTH domain